MNTQEVFDAVHSQKSTFTSLSDSELLTIHPSKKHNGFWWYSRAGLVWEGFKRPVTAAGLKIVLHNLPININWVSSPWDGNDMEELGSGKKIKLNRIVYFIEAVGLDCVKIGTAEGGAGSRLKALQTACPAKLRVLKEIDGGIVKERLLHQKFKSDRLHGEWFRLSPQIKNFIQESK